MISFHGNPAGECPLFCPWHGGYNYHFRSCTALAHDATECCNRTFARSIPSVTYPYYRCWYQKIASLHDPKVLARLFQYRLHTQVQTETYMVQATGYNRGFEPLTFPLIPNRSGLTTELLQSPLGPLQAPLLFSYWSPMHTSLFPRSSPPTCATPPFALVFPLFRSPLAPPL